MKKLTFSLILCLLSVFVFAQIPNADFENWTNMGAYDNLNEWGSLNNVTASSGVYTLAKGTSVPASGLAYVKLTTRDVGGIITPGIISSGQLDNTTLRPRSGFACNSRPEKLRGKWQYMGYGSDAATIAAWLTKWNADQQHRDTIASLTANPTGMLHNWGAFSFPFIYSSSATPDTAVIWISSSGKNPVKYSFIWVDDLGFDGTVTGIAQKEPETSPAIGIYPNPASTHVEIKYSSSRSENIAVSVSDNIGNQVIMESYPVSPGNNLISLDVSSPRIKSGIYFLQIQSSAGIYSRKLIIKK